jgi:glucose uptake protein GlcU
MSDAAIGAACLMGSVLLFGHYGVLIRFASPGDGFVFQFIVCAAVAFEGMILYVALQTSAFSWIAMLGGVVWVVGNCTIAPVISRVGLALGVLLWTVSNLLFGWLCGTLGILVPVERVAIPWLNYLGVGVACASFVIYLFVEVEVLPGQEEKSDKERLADRAVGIVLAILAGICYGFNSVPVQYESLRSDTSPLIWAFSHFSGVFCGGTIVLLIYCLVKGNAPVVPQKSFLHAALGGVFWATAQLLVFSSNRLLSLPVSYPIAVLGPAIVLNLWGVLYFKEIRGMRNLLTLGAAFAATTAGVVLIATSNI